MSSKKIKKFLQSEIIVKLEERIIALEARLHRALEERFGFLESFFHTAPKAAAEAPAQEADAVVADAESDKATGEKQRRKRRTRAEMEAAKVEEVVAAPVEVPAEPAKGKRTRRTSEEVAAEREALKPTPESLRNIQGIGLTLEEKLATVGVKSLKDMAELGDGDVEQIEESIKGFKKRFTTGRWAEQAKELLEKL